MMKLTDREWKPFPFPEIFEIKGGFYNKKPAAEENGEIPFVGATDSNNGITQFNTKKRIGETSKTGDRNNAPLDKKLFSGNCIVVTNNGSVGHAYYQKHPFTCSHDVNPLYLKHGKLTPNIAHFLICAIEKQRVCFSYVHKWRPKRMRKSKILLPVSSDGQPDYAFMEDYIKERELEKQREYLDYCEKQLEAIGEERGLPPLASKRWEPFPIGGKDGLFEILPGKRLTTADMRKGDRPFIGATDSNNGITNWVGNMNETCDSNVLGVNYNGSVVENFYHPYRCLFSDDVKRLHLRNHEDNQFVLLFLSRLILMQKAKYTYGYKFNGARMGKQKILVPTTEDGQPDYEYMERHIRNLMARKIRSCRAWLSRRTPLGGREKDRNPSAT